MKIIAIFDNILLNLNQLQAYYQSQKKPKQEALKKIREAKYYFSYYKEQELNKGLYVDKNKLVGLKLKEKLAALKSSFEGLNLGELKWQENHYKDALIFAKEDGNTAKAKELTTILELVLKQTKIQKEKIRQEA